MFDSKNIRSLLKACFLVFFILSLNSSCALFKSSDTPLTVEEAELLIKKQRKKQIKQALKARKKAHKAYWKMQTEQAKGSVKRNLKNQRRKHKGKDPLYENSF